MFKDASINPDFDDTNLSPLNRKSPIQAGIAVTDIDHTELLNKNSEWTESEESDDSASSGGEDSEDPDETAVLPSSISAPSHQFRFEPSPPSWTPSASSSSPLTETTSISAKSNRADLGILGRRRSESSPLSHTYKLSSPIIKEESKNPLRSSQSSDSAMTFSSDHHSARSPSPLGPGSSSPSPRPRLSRSPSIVLLNQRSPSVAMRHEVALRAFRNPRSRTSPTQESDASASSQSDDGSISPIELHPPVSAPLPEVARASDSSQQQSNRESTPERPATQIRHKSAPLVNQRRRSLRPNLPPLITPSPDQFSDGVNVEIIQDSFDEDSDVEQTQDSEDGKDSDELNSFRASSSRVAARKSLFSALGRESSSSTTSCSQILPKPSSCKTASSSHRRLPSLDQISSRVNAQNQNQSDLSTANSIQVSPVPRDQGGQPVLSTPLPHHRSFSCPTPQTYHHQSLGSVQVFITPPTPRCPFQGKTDATMEVLRSPTHEAFAFVPTGTNEKNRMAFLETGSPLLTPTWNHNGFSFGNFTFNLVPPPFEIAPGRTKKMEEQAKVMVEMMKKQQEQEMQLQKQRPNFAQPSSPHLIPGSPIPPKANQAMSFARDQASRYFAPRRRMISTPVGIGIGKTSGEAKDQVDGPKSKASGSDSPNWRSRDHIVPPLSPREFSSSASSTSPSRSPSNVTTRKPAGNHKHTLEGIKSKEKAREQTVSSPEIEVEEASPSVSPSNQEATSDSAVKPVPPPNPTRNAAGRLMVARLGQRKS